MVKTNLLAKKLEKEDILLLKKKCLLNNVETGFIIIIAYNLYTYKINIQSTNILHSTKK